jgi:hypothetical protein
MSRCRPESSEPEGRVYVLTRFTLDRNNPQGTLPHEIKPLLAPEGVRLPCESMLRAHNIKPQQSEPDLPYSLKSPSSLKPRLTLGRVRVCVSPEFTTQRLTRLRLDTPSSESVALLNTRHCWPGSARRRERCTRAFHGSRRCAIRVKAA